MAQRGILAIVFLALGRCSSGSAAPPDATRGDDGGASTPRDAAAEPDSTAALDAFGSDAASGEGMPRESP